jgi:cbb3-type cytochrome oxidase subunit 3
MKFVNYVLGDVEGIQIYYIVGLIIFIAFFLTVLYRTYKMPKSEAESIKEGILEEEDQKRFEQETSRSS